MSNYELTILANRQTYSAKEIKFIHSQAQRLKNYLIYFSDMCEPLRITSTDDETLKEYLQNNYNYDAVIGIDEKIVTLRKVL